MLHRVVGLSLLAALACNGEDADDGVDLQQQWLESAPQQYVAKVCATGFTIRVCTVSAVSAGEAVATQTKMPDGEWQDPETLRDVVQGMLNAATRDEDGCQRRVTPHDTYAFPERVFWSCQGEGHGAEIACFVPDTLDLSLCQ